SHLTPEQFTQTVAGSYGSVRNTMVHMLSAEWGWLDRCGGHKRGPALKPDDYPNVESLVETWRKVEGWVRAFLETRESRSESAGHPVGRERSGRRFREAGPRS